LRRGVFPILFRETEPIAAKRYTHSGTDAEIVMSPS